MKKSFLLFTVIMTGLAFMFSSCSKDDDTNGDIPNDNTVKVKLTTKNNVEVDKWVYFSFEKNSEVSGIDSSNFKSSTDWDIAFHSRHVRLNGGESGVKGYESIDMGVVGWDSVTNAPSEGYVKDKWMDDILFAGVGDNGPIMKGTYLNPAFETAFSFDPNTHPPTYIANKNVYVIKLGDNKYLKIMMMDYYNDMGESGYISFQYKFSKEGTSEF